MMEPRRETPHPGWKIGNIERKVLPFLSELSLCTAILKKL